MSIPVGSSSCGWPPIQGFDLDLQGSFLLALAHWEETGKSREVCTEVPAADRTTASVNARKAAGAVIEQAWFQSNRSAVEIDLSGLGLKSLPRCLAQLTNVTALNLTGNQFTAAPDLKSLVRNLTTLRIDVSDADRNLSEHFAEEKNRPRDCRFVNEGALENENTSEQNNQSARGSSSNDRFQSTPRGRTSSGGPSVVPDSSVVPDPSVVPNSSVVPGSSVVPNSSVVPDSSVVRTPSVEDVSPGQRTRNKNPPPSTLAYNPFELGRRGFLRKNAALGDLKGSEAREQIRNNGTLGDRLNYELRSGLKGFANVFGRKRRMAEVVNEKQLPSIPTASDISANPRSSTKFEAQMPRIPITPTIPGATITGQIHVTNYSDSSSPTNATPSHWDPTIPERRMTDANLSSSQSQSLHSVGVNLKYGGLAKEHPQDYIDRNGGVKKRTTGRPTLPSADSTWNDQSAVATFVPNQSSLPSVVAGIRLTVFQDGMSNREKIETHIRGLTEIRDATVLHKALSPSPIEQNNGKMNHLRAGVIARIPDGRIVVVESNNHHWVSATYPQGGVDERIYDLPDVSPERKLELAAIKEAYEESGLKVELDAHLGDFQIGINRYRFFVAQTKEGNPTNMDSEQQSVSFVPRNQVKEFFEKANAKTNVDAWKSTPEHRSEDVLAIETAFDIYCMVEKERNKLSSIITDLKSTNTLLERDHVQPLTYALGEEAKYLRDINDATTKRKKDYCKHVESFLVSTTEVTGFRSSRPPRRETAVKLKNPAPNGKQYIHANKIDFGNWNKAPRFIAAQIPIWTNDPQCQNQNNFWRTVDQENISVIVDLTQDIERGRISATRIPHYGPTEGSPSKKIDGKTLSRENSVDELIGSVQVTVESLTLIDGATSPRQIKRLHFAAWEDKKLITPQSLIELAALVKNTLATVPIDLRKIKPTVMIHCRHGIGRTGTLMSFMAASEHIDERLNEGKIVSSDDLLDIVIDVVRRGRLERGELFVSTAQFALLVNALGNKYFLS